MSSTRHSISARLPPHQLSCQNFRQTPTISGGKQTHQYKSPAPQGCTEREMEAHGKKTSGRRDRPGGQFTLLLPSSGRTCANCVRLCEHRTKPLTRMNTRMATTVPRMRRYIKCIPHPPTTFHSTRSWADGWKGIVECGMQRINRSDPSISKMGERRRRYNGIAEL